jgi:hypothetical protein
VSFGFVIVALLMMRDAAARSLKPDETMSRARGDGRLRLPLAAHPIDDAASISSPPFSSATVCPRGSSRRTCCGRREGLRVAAAALTVGAMVTSAALVPLADASSAGVRRCLAVAGYGLVVVFGVSPFWLTFLGSMLTGPPTP